MKVTNDQVFIAHNILSKINLNIIDKDVRVDVFKNAVELSEKYDSTQNKIDAAKNKMFAGFEKDIEKINALRTEFSNINTTETRKDAIINEINKYEQYLSLEEDFISFLNKLGKDVVEINLIPIDSEKFINMIDGIDVSIGQLNSISFLFKNKKGAN